MTDTKHVVTLEATAKRGDRTILVNGIQWGRIEMTLHGVWGTKYQFYQHHGEVIGDPANDFRPVQVRGEKGTRRAANLSRFDDTQIKPTEERLLAKAEELVAVGLLRDPAIVLRERDTRATAWRRQQAEAELAKEQALVAKADEAIRRSIGYHALHNGLRDNEGHPGFWMVAIYLVSLEYGGPEEGGWWFDQGNIVHEVMDLGTVPTGSEPLGVPRIFTDERAADEWRQLVQDRLDEIINTGLPAKSSVNSRGVYEAHVYDGFAPSFFPSQRPHYE